MTFRFFTLAVTLFWAGSVAWLCAVVWAPPGSRMSSVDPREVYRVFFEWNDSTDMTLLENGLRRGQVTIAGGSGEEEATGRFERVLSLSGSMESYEAGSAAPEVDLFWKGVFVFSEAMESRGGELTLRVPSRKLSAHFSFDGPTDGAKPAARAKVVVDGREILSLDPDSAAGGLAESLLGSVGVVPGLEMRDPSSWSVSTDARMGSFNLGGREMRAFLLTLRGDDPSQSIRVYLSEAGEPLRLETDLGFEAVSEILVPLDAYERRPPASDD